MRRNKWHFQDQHFGTTRGLCVSKSIYILSRKFAPITCTELLDHACLQLTRSTPQCTLRTQLFSHNAIHTKRHTLTISAKYQATIATYKCLSRTYQLLWRNETYTSTRTQLKNSQSIGATLSGMIVEYCKAFPTTLNV